MLKICLLLDELVVPNWEYRIVRGLLDKSPTVQITCVVLNRRENISINNKNPLRKIIGIINSSFIWSVYQIFTKKYLTQSFNPHDLSFLKAKKEILFLECEGIRAGKYRTRLPGEVIKQLRPLGLDIIIRFGFGILTGDVFQIPKNGIWSYHHDDMEKYRGGPPVFWQVFNGEKKIGSTLQIITEELDKGFELIKGFYKPCLSYIQTREKVFADSAQYVTNVIDQLLVGKTIGEIGKSPNYYSKKIYKAPKNLDAIRFIWREFIKQKKCWNDLWVEMKERWSIAGYHLTEKCILSGTINRGTEKFLFTNQNSDETSYFVADPFWIFHKEKYYLFYENCDSNNKANIALATSLDFINWKFEGVVLKEPFHLSYPSLVRSGDDIFMVPESYQAQEVRLYKANSDLDHWQYQGPLLSGEQFVDPTIFFKDGLWWMYVSCIPYENDVLRLYLSEEITGPWKEHPCSPIVRDPQYARMAGPVVRIGRKLIRFGQDNLDTYGRRVYAFEVNQLTRSDYSEVLIGPGPLLAPGKTFKDGVHHICLGLIHGDLKAVIDGKNFEANMRPLGEIARIITNKIRS